ncbi:GNAT family N-acetyltransferase [Methylobacterium sp. J-070]|uniref:GNAT family N-acetyltransferase n=1 Tax=Methylobacterium sp. J-070 TaxID=2836650 RepID=UPI001FBAB324|nr:GNAT family protein [Methylobacterium sp. J-070]MCJ2052617.1 GNAT family N-acetyltransferase [Methylobacterium sp. J-070]
MSGPGDLPESFVLDDAAPPAGEGEDLTLEGILREAGIDPASAFAPQPRPQTLHERMAQLLRPHAQPAGRAVVDLDDRPEQIAAWVNGAGRSLGYEPTWTRFISPDLVRGALFVLHSPHPDNEAELIVLADKGMINRPLIAGACRWAFYGLGLGRVVVRIPVNRPDLADLARRAGFRFEGTARRFYGGTLDAQIWAMAGADCPWLAPRSSTAAPVADMPPPSSLKVH